MNDCLDRVGNGVYEKLEEFDKTKEDQDEWETPLDVFDYLCWYHNLYPKYDVCADSINTKCKYYLTKKDNALFKDWGITTVWCNPPHSLTEEFVKKAQTEWQKYNINILMIVPANAIGAHYFDKTFDTKSATYHRYSGRINFTQHGIKKSSSRNGYFSVVWKTRKVKGLDPW